MSANALLMHRQLYIFHGASENSRPRCRHTLLTQRESSSKTIYLQKRGWRGPSEGKVGGWNSSRHISSAWLQRREYAKIESIIFLNGRCQMVTLRWSAVRDHCFPSAICDVWKIQPKCAHKLEIHSTFSYRCQAR